MYMRTRPRRPLMSLGALGSNGAWNWVGQSCSGSADFPMADGEVACVPAGQGGRADSRACVGVQVGGEPFCAQPGATDAGAYYCCPRRDKVRELQTAILRAGCRLPTYGADGLFGDETRAGINCLAQAVGWGSVVGRYPVVLSLVEVPEEFRPQPAAAAPIAPQPGQPAPPAPARSEWNKTWTILAVGVGGIGLFILMQYLMSGRGVGEVDVEERELRWREAPTGAY